VRINAQFGRRVLYLGLGIKEGNDENRYRWTTGFNGTNDKL